MTDFLSTEVPRIDTVLRQELETLPALLRPVAMHIATLPGKRLRPLICLATARCLGETGQAIYPLATALEIMHCACLLHDDILDDASTRRGATSAHLKYGAKLVILAGDAMFALAGGLMARSQNPRLTAIFSTAIGRAAAGQALEASRLFCPDFDQDHYTNVIAGKTAALFEASALIGAEAAAASKEQCDAAAGFGFNFGMAFQIMDDIMDFQPTAETGKPCGGDLLEGKLTPPAFLWLESLPITERQFFLDKFSQKLLASTDISAYCEQIQRHTLGKKAASQTKMYVYQGDFHLNLLPSNQFRDILQKVIHDLTKIGVVKS